MSIFDICPFSIARKPISRSDEKGTAWLLVSMDFFNNLTFGILEIF